VGNKQVLALKMKDKIILPTELFYLSSSVDNENK
jgi:hypothetical protein